MLTYTGKHNSANVMIDEIDETTVSQIYKFLNHPAFGGTYIAIMPDCHAGAGAVIGYTAKMNDYVIPNVVGVDIGCGVLAVNLGNDCKIDFHSLDKYIKKNIPSGFDIRSYKEKLPTGAFLEEALGKLTPSVLEVAGATGQERPRVIGSIGTLGGGNHFIEIDHRADNGVSWLLVHSGSRNFGLRIAKYYQNKAKSLTKAGFLEDTYRDLEYLTLDTGGNEYLEAMQVAQRYASVNRRVMAEIIIKYLAGEIDFDTTEKIESVHNYINFSDHIIRKGAISAHEGERLVIPFNMKDGVAIGRGKGNKLWNYSAPHGAGRLLSRSKAKQLLSLDEFRADMAGIYTTTATRNTIDEAPRAYKDTPGIIRTLSDTVDIECLMKPIYNFKAGEDKY